MPAETISTPARKKPKRAERGERKTREPAPSGDDKTTAPRWRIVTVGTVRRLAGWTRMAVRGTGKAVRGINRWLRKPGRLNVTAASLAPPVPAEPAKPAPPEPVFRAPERAPEVPPQGRQPRLVHPEPNVTTNTQETITVSNAFDTAIETIESICFIPDSGHDAERAVDGAIAALESLGGKISDVARSISDTLPQASDSMEHLAELGNAAQVLGRHASELADEWKASATWVWKNGTV